MGGREKAIGGGRREEAGGGADVAEGVTQSLVEGSQQSFRRRRRMVVLAVVRWWLEAGGHKVEVREAASHHIRQPEAPLPSSLRPPGDFLSLVAVAAEAQAHGVKEIQKWADTTKRIEKEKTWRSLSFFFLFFFLLLFLFKHWILFV